MSIETWTTRQRWLYAIKPGSWPKLLVPFVFGQMLGVLVAGEVNLAAVAFGFAFTILDGLFIVLLNDWGDQRVDRIKREMFPDGCSPKTIPDGILPARSLLVAGTLAGILAMGLAFIAELEIGREGLGAASIAALAIFAAYSLPPFRLNYRGGGEVLEAAGVGLALPLFNAYLQAGVAWAPHYEFLFGSIAMAMASALASGLADEESDRAGGKRTFTTMWGNEAVRTLVVMFMRLGMLLWIISAIRTEGLEFGVGAAVLITAFHLGRMRSRPDKATTNAFADLKLFKLHLHHAIWYGHLTLAAAMVVAHLIGAA